MKYIKFKDIFTILNLFLSFYAVILVMNGQFLYASILAFFNIMVLDFVDGLVARLTRTSNEFGKHLDSVTDFVGSSLIVPFFIFAAYRDFNIYIAVIGGFIPLLVGVIREVTSRLENVKSLGHFIGFPRNAAAITIICYLNSTFITLWKLYWVGFALILLVSFLQLSRIPFIGNDKTKAKFQTRFKFYLVFAVTSTVLCFYLGLFWDAIFMYLLAYILSPLALADKQIRNEISQQVE